MTKAVTGKKKAERSGHKKAVAEREDRYRDFGDKEGGGVHTYGMVRGPGPQVDVADLLDQKMFHDIFYDKHYQPRHAKEEPDDGQDD